MKALGKLLLALVLLWAGFVGLGASLCGGVLLIREIFFANDADAFTVGSYAVAAMVIGVPVAWFCFKGLRNLIRQVRAERDGEAP